MTGNIDENLLLFSPKFTDQKEYWVNRLSSDIVETKLQRGNKKEYLAPAEEKRENLEFSIPGDLSRTILKLSKESDLSAYLILLTGLKILIYNYTGNEDIIVQSPLYTPKVTEETLNNRVLIRDTVHEDLTFKMLLFSVRQSALEAYENQDYPLEKLLEYLFEGTTVKNSNHISGILCSMENLLEIEPQGTENTALAFIFKREGQQLKGKIEYDPREYETYYIRQMKNHLIKILQHALKDVNTKISGIFLLTHQEKEQLLVVFNNTAFLYPREKTIPDLYGEQEEQAPHRTAAVGLARYGQVEKGNQLVTYRELNRKSNQLAYLLRARGVGPNTIVGIMMERSVDFILSIMAILKAGGAYLPIDPDYPEARKINLLEDSGAKQLFTKHRILEQTPSLLQRYPEENILYLENETLYTGPGENPEKVNGPEDLAYVIYTSGTTGKPKGAMVNHRNVNNLVHGLNRRIYSQYKEVLNVALVSPFIFDASVKQVFAALLLGHSLFIVPENIRIDAVQLLRFYQNQLIDISDGIPTHLCMLSEVMENGFSPLGIKHFIIGGETLTRKIIDDFYSRFQGTSPKITNVYGPTECCVDATCYEIQGKDMSLPDPIPIGKPMPNYRIYILGSGSQLRPLGAAGELCIAGEGVGRGYLKRVQLTKEKFIPNPYTRENEITPDKTGNTPEVHQYNVLYKTGDLARWLPDGNIEFLGRIDQQVKIRGIRIELDEIKNQLLKNEKIKNAIVVARQSKGGDKYLCVYMVPAYTDTAATKPGEQQHLSQSEKNVKTYKDLILEDITGYPPGSPDLAPPNRTVLEYFEHQLHQYPDEIAIKSGPKSFSFRQLDRYTNQLAHLIINKYDDRSRLSKEERIRYTRQIMLDDWGIEAQEKIKSSTVCVVGAGGIGSPLLMQLALLGIGTIIVCDYDDVELSNLNRQFMHDNSRINMNKALSAQMTIQRINPHVNVIAYQEGITRENIDEIIGNSTILFDAVDDLETKFILSEYAVRKQIPHVLSAMIEISSYSALLHPPHSPCFHCLHDRGKADEIREIKQVIQNYKKNPFPVSSSALFTTTGFICNEAIKILLGQEDVAYNTFFLFNQKGSNRLSQTTGYRQMTYSFSRHFRDISKAQGFDWDECWRGNYVEELKIEPDPNCPVCGQRQNLEESKTARANPVNEELPAAETRKTAGPHQQSHTVVTMLQDDAYSTAGKLAVLKSGKAFLPLVPHLPQTQQFHILEDSGARLILADNVNINQAKDLRDQFNKRIPVVNVEEIEGTAAGESTAVEIHSDQVAYVSYEMKSSPASLEAEIKDYLAGELPDYMIPRNFVLLEEVPLTPSGKVDLNKLPEPGIKIDNDFAAPGDRVEEKLVEIWADILELQPDTIGLNANFFESGGHSLKATVMAARINKEFDIKISLAIIFKEPTLREMARFIKEKAVEQRYAAIKPTEEKEYYALSSAQQRLFVLNQMEGKIKGVAYNIPRCYEFEGTLDSQRFQEVFEQMVNRHAALRTSFHLIDGEPVQKVEPQIKFNVTFEQATESEAREKIKTFIRPFNLNQAPLMRTGLLQTGDRKYYILFDIHHIISDGLSMDILVQEFFQFYWGKKLKPLHVHYKDYAAWEKSIMGQEEFKTSEKYWMKKMDNFLFTRLSPDNLSTNQPVEEKRESLLLDKILYEKIEKFCNQKGITRFTFLMAVFIMVLAWETGQDDICIGTPFSNRDHYELKNLVGIFLNVLLMRTTLEQTDSFINNLTRLRQEVIAAFENSLYPYELLNFNVRKRIRMKSEELFTILFNYVTKQEEKDPMAKQFKMTSYSPGKNAPKYDIVLFVMDINRSINLSLIYKGNLYSDYRMQRFLENMKNIIDRGLANENIIMANLKPSEEEKFEEFDSNFEEFYENDDILIESGDV